VDSNGALESIAGLLSSLPDESVEGLLVTFDSLLAVSEGLSRPTAAQLLRNAADACRDPARRDRLLEAAAAVAAGQPCALAANQPDASRGVTQEQWEERIAQSPLPPLPGEHEESEDVDEDQVEEDDSLYMEEEPPTLPHLPVRHFFPGLAVRVGRDFADAYGRAACSSDLLKVLDCESTNSFCAVTFLDRNVRLSVADHGAIIGNEGNAWFQPVPTVGCLEELLEAIDVRLSEFEEDYDGEDDSRLEPIETLREDLGKCADWLSHTGERGPAPECRSGPLAAKVFGQDHELTAWIRMLFAAVAVSISDAHSSNMSSLREFKRLNTRKASIVHVGGFRPTGDPFASNFGLRPLGNPGEAWPTSNGAPLLFVCQLNLTAAPAVPELLRDIALITFFANPGLDFAKENGSGWSLRAYPSLTGLVPITPPANAPKLKRGFECSWEACDDHPNYDDPDRIVPDGFDDSDVDLENVDKTKIGGYASSIQSEPWWGYEEHPAAPAYCLQINGEEKVALAWGDGGMVYLARGTADGCKDQWFLDCQSY
jgi:hypothetical protein